ncbi:MAG: hypothetical protein WAT39_25035 [Planctomycetota bacterium]
MPSFRFVSCAVPILLAGAVPAQVPPGCFVLGTCAPPVPNPYPWLGGAGLFLGHPRTPGVLLEVAGLPAALVTPPPGWNYEYGIGGLAIHEATGELLVGNSPAPGAAHELRRIRIVPGATPGTYAAVVLATIPLGIAGPSGGWVNQIVVWDADNAIVNCTNVAGGAVGAGPQRIARVELSTGWVQPWSAISATFVAADQARAGCVDHTGSFAYFAGSPGNQPPSTVYRVPLTGGVPTSITAIATGLPFMAFTMQWDRANAKLLVSGRLNGSNGGSLWQVDPATGASLAVGPTGPTNMPVFDMEPTTGEILFAGVPSTGTPGVHHYVPGAPSQTFLTNATSAGMVGLPFAFAVAAAPTPYGSPTWFGGGLVTWAAVSTAGLPTVGNLNYSLRLDADGSILAGFLVASAGALNPGIPWSGWLLQVDPTLVVGQASFASSVIALPIPNTPTLANLDLFLQAATLTDFTGMGLFLAASEGAHLRIL